MEKKNKRRLSAYYLSPRKVIKDKQLSKKDVRTIKDNIATSMTLFHLIIAIFMYVLSFVVMMFMSVSSNWKQIETYGLTSVIAQVILMSCSLASIILIIVSYFIKKEQISIILNRISTIILFVGVTTQMILGIYTDAQMGFTSQPEILSASIVLVAVLMLIQPSYWTDAFILNILTAISLIVITIICAISFKMDGIFYYIVIALAYPIVTFAINNLLFYVECKNYEENIENERLTNKAYYDNLTLCKNRHALKLFLDENSSKWERKENLNLLIVLFDIDNFKEYNDKFSHLGGDYCLKSIAEGVRKAFPSPSLDFFRYGGEEFLLFFELENKEDAKATMEKIRKSIEGLNIEAPEGAPQKIVTISVGGTLIRSVKHFSFEEQMSTVDKYLYEAKNSGKDVSCLDGKLI